MACSRDNNSDILDLTGFEAPRFKANLKVHSSLLALRPLLATTGALLASNMLAAPALAECVPAPDVVCDGASGPSTITGIFGFQSVTYINGQTNVGPGGLTYDSSPLAIGNFAMDATSAITSSATTALRLTSSTGSIGTTTPSYTGIDGDLISTAGYGLEASTSAAGGDIDILQGASSTISGTLGGVNLTTTGGAGSNVTAVFNGTVDGSTGISGNGITINAADLSTLTTTGQVDGSDFGISATSGGNNVIAVNGGSVMGAGGGIVATSTSGDVNVTVGSGASVAGTGGIGVNLTAGGAVSLTNNGSILGATDAVSITSGAAATTATTVTGSGTFTALNGDAINIQNNGSIGTTVNISGAVTASGGHGITVRDTATGGDIAVTTGSVSAPDAGQDAVDIQTLSTTADITVATNGTLTAGNAGIVAAILPATATGNISVTSVGPINARFGIDAENFGTGTTSVTTTGAINVTSGNGIFARTGGGNVTVNSGAVTSTGNTAIVARQTNAAGTGTVSVTTNGAVSGTTGIEATNSGTGTTSVTANAAVTGTTAEGIKVSGNDGVTVVANGTVTGATRGLDLTGGTGGSGNISVTGTGGFVGGTGDGAFIQNNGSGTVTYNVSGATSSTSGHGIIVRDTAAGGDIAVTTGSVSAPAAGQDAVDIQSLSTTADITVATNGTLTAGNAGIVAAILPATATGNISVTSVGPINARFGIDAENFGTGTTSVTTTGAINVTSGNGIFARTGGGNVTVNSGAVTSTGNTAIVARQTNAAGTGTVSVTTNGAVSGTTGIEATNSGSGALAVAANANVTGTAGPGISASLTNPASQGNSMTVVVAAGTTTTGTGAAGIVTNLGQSTGSALVTLNGRATGTIGVQQLAVAGTNSVNVAAGGQATGTVTGISQTTTGAGNATLVNSGTVTGGTDAVLATLAGGTYTLTNNSGGILNGAVTVTGNAAAGSLFTNAGTWNATGVSTFTGSMTNSGTTNVAAGAAIAVPGGITNSASGVFRFAGNGTITANFANAGLIDARNSTVGQVITVTGNYTGGGAVGLDASLGTNTADRLVITGTATGATNVLVNVTSLGILPTGFLPLVTVGTGTPLAGTFTGTLPVSGLLAQTFGVNPANANQFGIIQTFNPTSSQLSQLSTLAGSVSALIDDPVSVLVTDRTDRPSYFGIWGRGSAGDLNQDLVTTFGAPGGSTTLNAEARTSYYTIQSGLDFGLSGLMGSLNLHVGITGGRYGSSTKLNGGVTRIDADFLGGYVALTGGGLQIDATYRREWRDYSIQNASLIAAGNVATEGKAWAGSVNASYKLGMGGFFVKPAIGYSFGSGEITPFAIDALTTVTPVDDKSGLLRYGGTIGWEGNVSPDLVLSPYVGLFGLHNTSNSEVTDLVFGSTVVPTVTTGFKDTMQVVAGLDMHDEENQIGAFTRGSFYTSNGVTGASFSVGARINF